MPLAVQFVQAAVFTPDQAAPYDLFVAAFGVPPTQLQPAQPPLMGTVALAVADGRNLVLQVTPGRHDLFTASVENQAENALPGQFTPVVNPEGAIELVAAAAARLAGTRTTVNRINLAIRYVQPVENSAEASALFALLTGIPPERVGASDNIFQSNNPGTIEKLPGAMLARTQRWQTEQIVVVTLPSFPPMSVGAPLSVNRRENYAVSLNVDVGVIPQDGVIPVDMVGDLFHQAREIAVGLAPADRSGEDKS